MKRGQLFSVGFLVSMFALLAAWPTWEPVAPLKEARAAEPDAEFQAKWKALIKAAKREGKMVSITTGGGGLDMAPVLKTFSKKFGIRVVISRGSGREQSDRVLAEQRADRFTVDTIQTGKSTMNLRYVPNKALQPIEPLLFHPEVIDKSKWYGNRFWYVDGPQRYIFVYAADLDCEGGVSTSVWWNTNLVTLKEAASWTSDWDILSKKYAGKLLVRSPMDAGAMGGIAGTFVQRGPGYLKRWYADPTLKIFYTNDVNVMTDGVAKGRFHIGLSMGRTGLNRLRDYGAPVEDYRTAAAENGWKAGEELCDLTDHGIDGTITVARNNPHPNATKLFLNWLLSREGQTVIQAKKKVRVRPDGLHTRQTLRTDGIPRGLVDPITAFSYDKQYVGLDFDPNLEQLREAVTKWVRAVHREGYFGGPKASPPPGLPEKFGKFKKFWR